MSFDGVKTLYGKMENMSEYAGSDRVLPWQDYLAEQEKNQQQAISLMTGYNELDFLVGGFQSQELITLSGTTGMGKTLFTKALVKGFSSLNVPVVVFTFEDPARRWLEPFKDLPNLLPIFVPRELKLGNVEWIIEKVIEARAKFDCKIVVLDHLHYVVGMETNRSLSVDIGATMRILKMRLATELNQIVFLVCHQEKVHDDIEPGLSTIRDSSFIGQESDTVIIVNRMPDEATRIESEGFRDKRVKIPPSEWTYEKGYCMVKIEKARRVGTFRKKITFVKKGAWLEPL